MTAHKHAALMLQYAQDAAETDKPWERWEYLKHQSSDWGPVSCMIGWFPENEYRRKPRTMTYTVTIPEPLREAPELLEALKLALEYWRHRQQRYKNRSPVWVQAARAAITKATGEQE